MSAAQTTTGRAAPESDPDWPEIQSRARFEAALGALIEAEQTGDNQGCVACMDCVACIDSTFCEKSRALVRCHYCVRTEQCSGSTHCLDCRDLVGCSHCERTTRSQQSSYLIDCAGCTGCTYCFGCVGLVGKDFHVLNRPVSRRAYFEILEKLRGTTPRSPVRR